MLWQFIFSPSMKNIPITSLLSISLSTILLAVRLTAEIRIHQVSSEISDFAGSTTMHNFGLVLMIVLLSFALALYGFLKKIAWSKCALYLWLISALVSLNPVLLVLKI